MRLVAFIKSLFTPAAKKQDEPQLMVSRLLSDVNPEVRNLVMQAKLATVRSTKIRPGPLGYRHRRSATEFHLNAARAVVPAGFLRSDVLFPDPWWSHTVVAKEIPGAEAAIKKHPDGAVVVAEHEYALVLLDGRQATQVRLELISSGGVRRKEFYVRFADGSIDSFDKLPHALLPLYMPTQELLREQQPVILCEGVPAAAFLAQNFQIATAATLTGALGTPSRAALEAIAKCSPIYLWPDNDDVGVRHMQRVAQRLHNMGVKQIKIIRWLGAPRKADAADFSADQAALAELIDKATNWTPDSPIRSRGVLAVNPPRAGLRLRLAESDRPGNPPIGDQPDIMLHAEIRQICQHLKPLQQALEQNNSVSQDDELRAKYLLKRVQALIKKLEGRSSCL